MASPAAPTLLLLWNDASGQGINVIPGADGGSPITRLEWRSRRGSGAFGEWMASHFSATVLVFNELSGRPLLPGTDYGIEIRAVNADGNGAPSAELTLTTFGDPPVELPAEQMIWTLAVPIHNIHGDAPAVAGALFIRLRRLDGNEHLPLYGARGALLGLDATQPILPTAADPSTISEGVKDFLLLATAYYTVDTVYELTADGRTYRFSMPARNASLIELMDEET